MILHLILKKEWYNMVESGKKKYEYRKITPYWTERFRKKHLFTKICFHYGYTKKQMTFEFISLAVDTGVKELGAVPDVMYYVIRLGNRIS